ncbi:IS110 family transposase [Neolewinella agarilytica]|uniref:IS110 family transposase n=1 Tax=Neolewinella agarilytica TaxID=478744 RepID=UPI002356956C|nr:IS110 family transposase [Neolewinella agarilytica]
MTNSNIIAYCVGVDISSESFDACLQKVYDNRTLEMVATKQFKNTLTGSKAFAEWLSTKGALKELVHVGMEATGRYYEPLAYFLFEQGYTLSVILANKIKYFARSLNEFSKTDAIDAKIIASYVSRHVPIAWAPMSPLMRQLRELSRDREALTKTCTMSKNRLKALRAGHKPLKVTIKRLEKQVRFLQKQIKEIELEMDLLREQDKTLGERYELLVSIPYIGKITAYVIMAETDCFHLFENRNQLIKYAGLDIIQNQSGTSVNGTSRISKRGNAHLRSAPYPGLGSISRGKSVFAKTYTKAIEKGMEKKQARTAVIRQLLRVAFGVVKSGQPYQAEIHRSRTTKKIGELEGSPTVTGLAS